MVLSVLINILSVVRPSHRRGMHLRDVPGKLTSGISTLNKREDLIIKGKGLAASFLIFGMSLQPNQSLDTGAYKFWNTYRNVGIPNIIQSSYPVSGFIQ